MSKEKRKVELTIDPVALVLAALNYVSASLPHSPEEKLDTGEITLKGVTPPLKISAFVFWLQFGKRKRFKHAGLEVTVSIPHVALVEMAFQTVLMTSEARGLGLFNEMLEMISPFALALAEKDPGAFDESFCNDFRGLDKEMQAKSIDLLRVQFAFEIVRYSLLGETIKFYDGHARVPGLSQADLRDSFGAIDLAEDRARCVRMRERFPYFVRLWGQYFRIYYGLGPPHSFEANEPIKTFIPEVLWPWIDLTN